MADAIRKQQLAAARKKLKAYKKTGGSASPHDNSNQRSQSPQNIQNSIDHSTVTDDKQHHNSVNHGHPTIEVSNHYGDVQEQKQDQLNNSTDHSIDKNSFVNSHVPNSIPVNRPYTSSTESLHQLSRHVSELIAQSGALINGNGTEEDHTRNGIEELEGRNRELAQSLSQQSQVNAHLNAQLNDLKQQCSRLQENLEVEKKSHDEKLKREMTSLKEQLQVHIQTIGILVAEKTELQSSLNQTLKANESKIAEIEELNGRLKASRQRVSDLERNFSSANTANIKHEKSSKDLGKEVDKLKMDLYKLNKSNEEFQQHNLELQGKLQKKIKESATLEDEIIELKGQLEMSTVHIQQLKSGGADEGRNLESDKQLNHKIEQLLADKSELSAKLEQKDVAIDQMRQEIETTKQQYSQYIEQIQTQAQQLQQQVVVLGREKDEHLTRCQELESIILDWKAKHGAATEVTVLEAEEKSELLGQIEKLRAHVEAISKNMEVQVADNAQLGRLIIEKEQRIVELELTVERMSDTEIDKDRLLEAMNSDKSALSRAMAQNKELKNQLTELQNGFVKTSKDNMDLMTQLQNEQHISKELGTRFSQQEEELKEINHQLQVKELELGEMLRVGERGRGEEDEERRVEHFHQMSPLIDNLQRELSSAQDTINTLTNQNVELRNKVSAQPSSSSNGYAEDYDLSRVEGLNAAVVQLELERNHVMEELKESQTIQHALQDKLNHIQQDLATQVPATLNGDVITRVQFEALQHAMKQLEDKYTRVMRDKAELVDKTERLEHIVMQLQGETDTIGEYISLYQQQRSILRARTAEKDGYIYRLAQERLDMQTKLGQLQALVMQLMGERNMLHTYRPFHEVQPHSEVRDVPDMGEPAVKRKRERKRRKEEGEEGESEDWPDLSTDSDDEADSPVNHSEPSTNHITASHSTLPPDLQTTPSSSVIGGDLTAQRIMTLLNEIGTSNVIERHMYDDRHFIHCNRCIGPIHVL